jgi:hypothetical protein
VNRNGNCFQDKNKLRKSLCQRKIIELAWFGSIQQKILLKSTAQKRAKYPRGFVKFGFHSELIERRSVALADYTAAFFTSYIL